MLKPTAAFVAALLISSPATSGEKPSPEEFCRSVSIFSENVMGLRQGGMPLTETLDQLAKNPLAREIMLSAYEVDMRFTETGKNRESGVFRDEWTLKCYRGELAALAP